MKSATPSLHGASELTSVVVETYNAELRDGEGFVGDRGSNRAFRMILGDLRRRLRQVGEDPFGDTPTCDLSKKKLDKILVQGNPEAAGVIQGAIESFASELSGILKRFLKLSAWKNVERIVVGGGLRASRIGELAIGRTTVLLKESGHAIDLVPIRHHPDEAGLIGAVHLAPAWVFARHDAILAVDIGGANVRAGVVELHHKKPNLSKCTVRDAEQWRYADESSKPSRDDAVKRIGVMLARLTKRAEAKSKLAPFVGLACPGLIAADGHIDRGGQNLPGNWESPRFNLPDSLRAALPRIGTNDTVVVMHNDAVVQGLSELPFLKGVSKWGVLTIGTGLGNAAFTNRARPRP